MRKQHLASLQASCRLEGTIIRRKQTQVSIQGSQSKCTLWNQPGKELVQNRHRTIRGPIPASRLWPKKWKISLLNGYSSWCKHAINKFLIDNSASCSSQDIHVFGILYWAIHRWRTTYLQTISYTSYEIQSSGFLLMQYFVWSHLWHFGVTFGSRLWHFWYRSCAHSCTDRKASQFLFWKYFSSTK